MNLIKQLIYAGIEEEEAKKEISILESEIKDKEKIKKIVEERIRTRTPLQYILGKAYFMDFELKVNNNVLIPRPETEILVEEAVRRCVACKASTALDIGTGSGNIAIALAKMIPEIKIVAIDINKEIINLASENAKINKVKNNIIFKICDVFSECFEALLRNQRFDLIISNPPYLKKAEEQETKKRTMQPEVLHEPSTALFGTKENKTGLIYYERIIDLLRRERSRSFPTIVAFEIDPSIVDDLKKLLKEHHLEKYEIMKDYSKLERYLFIYF